MLFAGFQNNCFILLLHLFNNSLPGLTTKEDLGFRSQWRLLFHVVMTDHIFYYPPVTAMLCVIQISAIYSRISKPPVKWKELQNLIPTVTKLWQKSTMNTNTVWHRGSHGHNPHLQQLHTKILPQGGPNMKLKKVT
jgi:hypothetical protein